jgi:thiol-disulfide isomerase/thioredoxin
MNKNLFVKNSNVIELVETDFIKKHNKYIINHKSFKQTNGLIMLYAPWCKHCKESVDNWEYLANIFNNDFVIAAINSESDNNYMTLYNLNLKRQFPTFIQTDLTGKLSIYKGVSDKDGLLHHVCKNMRKLS